ncbi:hypothetical protein [Ancylomarina longa]|uniref:J domain-containing protein n=1 Tax=Ancylomarina longa TaxID=2487017 RepID=A0A434AWL1_9BACT|nr:hypothetical protein [Ancylomarina longa]RUT78908.1 hypothetical protein DLK05_05330 [Ancylomarina longa]
MVEKNIPISNQIESEQLLLKEQIEALKFKLENIEQETTAFENFLRSKLIDELIEEQELSILYKKLKQAKKNKRLEQKKRGKKYKKNEGLTSIPKAKIEITSKVKQKEIKRLYREAMFYVHPDKFSMNNDKIELATEVTCKLIEIYQSGNLKELQIYHAQLLGGNDLHQIVDSKSEEIRITAQYSYLQNEKKKLLKLLEIARNKHTYRVFTEYENPQLFVNELIAYYADRISKLKKRTKRANKIN